MSARTGTAPKRADERTVKIPWNEVASDAPAGKTRRELGLKGPAPGFLRPAPARGSGFFRIGSEHDIRPVLFHRLLAYTLHLRQVICGLERPMGRTKGHNGLGLGVTDTL